VVSCLEPVFSIVMAAIVLGEILRPIQMIGIVIVLAAIIVVQLPDRKSRGSLPEIEPIE
jgi:drug/metabolite transporter (DMT)-like permease